MTNQSESALPVSGQPTPTGSQGAGNGQPSSTDVPVFTDAQAAYVQQLIEKQWQSGKDRRIASLDEKVNDIDARLNRYDELRNLGMSPQQARREMQLDELLQSRSAPAQAQGTSPANGVPQATQPSVEFENVIKAVGLDPNDRDVWMLAGKHGKDQAAFTHALVQLKMSRATAPPPSQAAMPPSPGGTAPAVNNDQQIAELQRLLQTPGQRDFKRIAELKSQLAKG